MKIRAIQCFFCIFIMGFALLCGLSQRQKAHGVVPVLSEPNEEQAFENVLRSCVRLQGEGYYGSGNIYRITSRDVIIVTNKHVLQYFGKDSYVTFFDGKEAAAEVLWQSVDYDLGFLAVEKADFTEEELSAYGSVSGTAKNYDDLKKNDSIFMADIATDINHPQKHSGEVMDSRKYLEDYGREMLYGDAYAKEGMSGCGVFDVYGNYLALLSGGTEYNEIAAVPFDVIETEYQKIKK